MSDDSLPEWERLLSAAARLQEIVPATVLVGGTAAAMYAHHRVSRDADHVLPNLRERFDAILASLESVAGWRTARVSRPVLILGSLDGIETGIRQLIREQPLETVEVTIAPGVRVTVPSEEEILRIKAALILKRNATRDYIDFVALGDHLGEKRALTAMANFDSLYPQPNGESALQQLQVQLAQPLPYDLDEVELAEYRQLNPRWQNWSSIQKFCADFAVLLLDQSAKLLNG